MLAIIDSSLCNEGVPQRTLVIGRLHWWGIDLQIKLQLSVLEYTETGGKSVSLDYSEHSEMYWDWEDGTLNSGLIPIPPHTVNKPVLVSHEGHWMTARAHFEKLKVLTCGLVLCNFARLMENPCLHTHTWSHFTYFTADHVLDLLVEVYEWYKPSLFKYNSCWAVLT